MEEIKRKPGRPKLPPELKKPRKKRKYVYKYRPYKRIPEHLHKKSGPKPRMMTFEEARNYVRDEGITSVNMYRKWYKLNRPGRIPRNPDIIYKDQWGGWNDFLGTYNENFCLARKDLNYVKYEDAKTFAHRLSATTHREWLDFCRSGNKPWNIPSRPDVVYRKEWVSWKQFLGPNGVEKIIHQNKQEKLIFIAKYSYMPSNVFRIDITNVSTEMLKYYSKEHKFKIIKLYILDNELLFTRLVEKNCVIWDQAGDEKDYYCVNIFDLIMDLDLNFPLKMI